MEWKPKREKLNTFLPPFPIQNGAWLGLIIEGLEHGSASILERRTLNWMVGQILLFYKNYFTDH